jgi:hypothetical protein
MSNKEQEGQLIQQLKDCLKEYNVNAQELVIKKLQVILINWIRCNQQEKEAELKITKLEIKQLEIMAIISFCYDLLSDLTEEEKGVG